jgi:beta-xylosidase
VTGTGGAIATGGVSATGGASSSGGSSATGGQGSGGAAGAGTGGGSTTPTGGSGAIASGGAGGGGGATGGTGGAHDAATGADAIDPLAPTAFDNPIIKYDAPDPTAGPGANIFTADGAAMVWNDKVYLYVDKDAAAVGGSGYVITDWLLYETSDMIKWESKGSIATCKSLSWCTVGSDGGLAAPQVIERDDKDGNPKFYLYGPANNGQGISIAVMVADKPEGPFKDARGIPIITPADTANMGATHSWRNLDPTAFVDDDGQAYLAWGNQIFFTVKLEDDMIHLKGETYTLDAAGKMQNRSISNVKITAHPKASTGDWSDYEEAPWLSKHGSLYYLTYAAGFPETINYATSTSPEGPWQFRGVVIARESKDSSTLHQTLFDFRGASYMGYHSAELPTGSDYRRSQCMDRIYYNTDGTLKRLVRTHK